MKFLFLVILVFLLLFIWCSLRIASFYDQYEEDEEKM